MNISVPSAVLDYTSPVTKVIAYKQGHRDARHAAAELSLKAEAYIEKLGDTLLESIGAMLGGNLTRESDMGKSILDALKQKAYDD